MSVTDIDKFVGEMNRISCELGMTNSHFVDPSGLGRNGKMSTSTARDLTRLGAKYLSDKSVSKIWNETEKVVKVEGDENILVKTHSRPKILLENYKILGGKTGSNGKDKQTFVCAANINGSIVVGAIMGAVSEKGRFFAMKELFDNVKTVLRGGPAGAVESAVSACALLPPNKFIYEQNADIVSETMSTLKLLTVLTASPYIDNLQEKITIEEEDLEGTANTSGSIFKNGDVVTVEDLLYSILLASSNQAANAIARYVGQKISGA